MSGHGRPGSLSLRPAVCTRGGSTPALLLLLIVACAHAAFAGSVTEEKELGRKFELQSRARLPLITDIEVSSYIDRIGQKIVAALDNQPFAYQFSVVRDPRINAFAVPGGYIYVHGGLLTHARNDDEVAGVLGHEIAHVNAHHLVRQQEATELMNYATLLGVLLSVLQPAAGAGAMAINTATQLQYRREFEQEADYLGARYIQKAGYDARGMLAFFKEMLDEQRTTPTAVPPYLLSHPLTDQRLTNLEAVLKTHQWSQGARAAPSLELERVQLLVRARSEQATDVVTFYRRRVDANPGDGRARYLLGTAFLETGSYEAARTTLEGARAAGFAAVDRELGRTAFALREFEPARDLLRRAASASPNDAVAHFELAKSLQALDDTAAAMTEYERALHLPPWVYYAKYTRGLRAGRPVMAAEGLFHIATALQLRGEHEKALSQFEKAQPLLPPGSAQAVATHAAIEDLKDYLGKR